MAFRRRDEPESGDGHEALREQWLALDELKRELTERVLAVQERERELQQAIAASGGASGAVPTPTRRPASDPAGPGQQERLALTDRDRALSQREAELDARDAELEAREAALSSREAELDARATASIGVETRIAELRDAERLFLRTRDELAARSEAVATRERLVAQRERELDDRHAPPVLPPLAIGELEARLRRLERRQTSDEDTQSFSAGLRRLQHSSRGDRAPGP